MVDVDVDVAVAVDVDVDVACWTPPSVLPLLVAEEEDAIDEAMVVVASVVVAAEVVDVLSDVDAELDATEVAADEVEVVVAELDVEATDEVELENESVLGVDAVVPEGGM